MVKATVFHETNAPASHIIMQHSCNLHTVIVVRLYNLTRTQHSALFTCVQVEFDGSLGLELVRDEDAEGLHHVGGACGIVVRTRRTSPVVVVVVDGVQVRTEDDDGSSEVAAGDACDNAALGGGRVVEETHGGTAAGVSSL